MGHCGWLNLDGSHSGQVLFKNVLWFLIATPFSNFIKKYQTESNRIDAADHLQFPQYLWLQFFNFMKMRQKGQKCHHATVFGKMTLLFCPSQTRQIVTPLTCCQTIVERRNRQKVRSKSCRNEREYVAYSRSIRLQSHYQVSEDFLSFTKNYWIFNGNNFIIGANVPFLSDCTKTKTLSWLFYWGVSHIKKDIFSGFFQGI